MSELKAEITKELLQRNVSTFRMALVKVCKIANMVLIAKDHLLHLNSEGYENDILFCYLVLGNRIVLLLCLALKS